ncbi:alpha/beta hydrolase family protein [Arenimonas sp.]|uniref:alpha/beta hydrolase family protein n=1 Tax=Arenimonas sp. TaxID=1872635 RepID=UPI0039E2BE31
MHHRFLPALFATALSLASLPPALADDAPQADALTQSLLKRAEFEQFRLSPNGQLIAIERRMPEGSVVSIHKRDTLEPLLNLDPGKGGEISTIIWLDDERIIVGANRVDGYFGMTMVEPKLSVIRIDGGDTFQLPGTFYSTLDDDPDHILVYRCSPTSSGGKCIPQLRKADVNKLRKAGDLLVEGPADTGMLADRRGNARFAYGTEDDGTTRSWVRDSAGTWSIFNDSSKTGVDIIPLLVAADGSYGLVQSQRKQGTDIIERYDFATGARTPVYTNEASDPIRMLRSLDGKDIVGARYQPTRPTVEFWNKQHPDAQILSDLHHAFPGQEVFVHSASKDGQWIIVLATSDRDPGTFILFDRKAMKAKLLSRRKPWIDPAKQGKQQSVQVASRDGVPLHGVLTLPPGSDGKNLPLVVLPHGGPFEIFDEWGYDPEWQILAQHGYAVLAVNFRGSGGYGRQFADRGLRQWGGAMQDDIADVTRHVLAQGIADPKRVCVYGASYGGYAAMMQPIRYPDMYKCAIGLSGVYDLSKMYRWGDIRRSDYGKAYLERALGKDPAELAANSPLNQVDKLKVPVFLAHGRLDGRVDLKHALRMREALEERNASLEFFEIPQTGHSITLDRYEYEFYARLLRFLDRNIGGKATTAAN